MADVEFTKILQRVVAVIGQTPRAESYPPGFQTVDGLELPEVANDNDLTFFPGKHQHVHLPGMLRRSSAQHLPATRVARALWQKQLMAAQRNTIPGNGCTCAIV